MIHGGDRHGGAFAAFGGDRAVFGGHRLAFGGLGLPRFADSLGPALGVPDGLRVRARLFDPDAIGTYLGGLRFRNEKMQQVIELLSLSRGERGRSRGRISYAQLGISQLGAVYESLLSFSGFFATEDLIELKAAGKPAPGPLEAAFFAPKRRAGDFVQGATELEGEFVYDDEHLIVRNPLITDLSNVGRIFSSGYWDFQPEAERVPYWRPLTALLHAIVWQFSGSDPRGYHVLSIAVHLAATTLAFYLVHRLTSSTWIAAVAALLFGLHPAQVESVAWVSGLNDPLCGLFVLAALGSHLVWRQRGSSGLPIAPAIACAFALLAKEQGAATLPLVLALDVGRRREPSEPAGFFGGCGSPRRAYGPLLAVLGLYVLARMIVFEVRGNT